MSLTSGSDGHPVDSNIHIRVIETSVFNSPSSGNTYFSRSVWSVCPGVIDRCSGGHPVDSNIHTRVIETSDSIHPVQVIHISLDLYGQCGQVSLTGGSGGHPVDSNIHTRVIETSFFNSPSSGNTYFSRSVWSVCPGVIDRCSGGHPVDSNIHTRVIETSVFNSPSSGNYIYL